MKPNYTVIKWDSCFELGIPVIDKQHRSLLRITNKLHNAYLDNNETPNWLFIETAREVIECVRNHLNTEEKIMFLLKCNGLNDHKKQNEEFIEKIQFETSHDSDVKKITPPPFVYFLKDWVLSHVMNHDKILSKHFDNMKTHGKFEMLLYSKNSI